MTAILQSNSSNNHFLKEIRIKIYNSKISRNLQINNNNFNKNVKMRRISPYVFGNLIKLVKRNYNNIIREHGTIWIYISQVNWNSRNLISYRKQG